MTFYNGDTFVSSYILSIGKYKSISAVIPNDANKVCFTIYKSNATISEFADVQFYINNSIYKLSDDVAELKNDLENIDKVVVENGITFIFSKTGNVKQIIWEGVLINTVNAWNNLVTIPVEFRPSKSNFYFNDS